MRWCHLWRWMRCLVPVKLDIYQNKIWCNIVQTDDASIILGQPWLAKRKVTIDSYSNSCSFVYNGKKVIVIFSKPKPVIPKKKDAINNKGLSTSSPKELKKEANKEPTLVDRHYGGCWEHSVWAAWETYLCSTITYRAIIKSLNLIRHPLINIIGQDCTRVDIDLAFTSSSTSQALTITSRTVLLR